MNGAQVTALVALIDEVASHNIPPETARALISAAFPRVKPELIDAMLAGLKDFEKPVPPPPVIAPGGLGAPAKLPPPPGAAPGKPVATAAKAAPKLAARQAALARVLNKVLYKTGKSVARQVIAAKAAPADELAKGPTITATVDLSTLDDASDALSEAINAVAVTSAADSIDKVGVTKSHLVNLANTRAERWAAKRSADLIGSDADGGELAAATRDMIKSTILEAEKNGWSNNQLKSALEDNYAFSPERAEVIARTELKMADGAGNMIGYRSSGVVSGKEWMTSEDDSCDDCAGNEADGIVPLDDTFSSGDDTVPAHPNCNCSVSPVLSDDASDNQDDPQE